MITRVVLQFHVYVLLIILVDSFSNPFSRSDAMPSSSSSNNNNPTVEKDDGIIMLSGYPFYVNGPDPQQIALVEAKVKATLEKALKDSEHIIISFGRMGSSNIEGIAGTPVCDLLAQVSNWPLSDKVKAKLAEKGYECKGDAPHAPPGGDEWFFGGDGEPGHLGRVVLHTVPEGSRFVQDMQAFVTYVNAHPDAFRRYNDVKVEGAKLMLESPEQEGRLLGYKAKKNGVCEEIKQEAIKWWEERQRYRYSSGSTNSKET